MRAVIQGHDGEAAIIIRTGWYIRGRALPNDLFGKADTAQYGKCFRTLGFR